MLHSERPEQQKSEEDSQQADIQVTRASTAKPPKLLQSQLNVENMLLYFTAMSTARRLL